MVIFSLSDLREFKNRDDCVEGCYCSKSCAELGEHVAVLPSQSVALTFFHERIPVAITTDDCGSHFTRA